MKNKTILVFAFFCISQHIIAQKKPNILLIIADDWSKNAGCYGDKAVKTPNIDKIAASGMIFKNAFCATPSCTPSRAGLLTGKYPHQLEEGANLYGTLDIKYPNYTKILEKAGYHVGVERKGWGPGKPEKGGYNQNPAGKQYANFDEFISKKNQGQAFCFWFGTHDPHRPYEGNAGINDGIDTSKIIVPSWLPNNPIVKADIADYYFEIQRFDTEVGKIIDKLLEINELNNTLIIITSDNGMPFPRSKSSIYDSGTNIPLIVSWQNTITANSKTQDTFVNLIDLAPTFLEAAGEAVPKEMTGKSLMPFLLNKTTYHRKEVYLERERHANVRKGNESYPVRAIRTSKFLYVRNFEPNLYPAGDPVKWFSVGRYGDTDNSPTKDLILDNPTIFEKYFKIAFTKRPAEELYDLSLDPDQLNNVVGNVKYQKYLKKSQTNLKKWMKTTQDPRLKPTNVFTNYEFYGNAGK